MKNLLFLFLLVISFNNISAQTSKPKNNSSVRPKSSDDVKKDNRPVRPIEIENLVAEAYYLPPEFAADALMRLAKSKKVTDKQWKKELIEAAFRFAAEAQQPTRRKNANLGTYSVDTNSGYLSYAFGQNLDKLSLQNRAVKMMLDLDKQRARQLFGEIPAKLNLPPLSCDDALVYDVAEFYDTLRLIAEKTFTSEQIKQGERMQFILPYIEAISFHAQIVPTLKAVVSLKPTMYESLTLISAFAESLKKIKSEDRSFSYEIVRGGMLREIFQLAQTLEQYQISSQSLLKEYRAYLQKNLNDSRCADSAINDKAVLSAVLRDSNSFFFTTISLTEDDVKPDEVLGKAKVYEFWQSAKAKRLQTLIKELRFGSKTESFGDEDENKPLIQAEKLTAEWRGQLNQFLNELEDWRADDERSAIDYFHQKQVIYMALAEIVPDKATRTLVVRSWLTNLDDASIEKQNRIEWRLYADYLLKFANNLAPEERAKTLEIISSSRNSSLVLYAKLTQQQL